MSKFLKKIVVVMVLAFTIMPVMSYQAHAKEYDACACSEPTQNTILNNCKMSDGTLGFCDNGEKGEGTFYVLQIVIDIMTGCVAILAVIGISICGVVLLTSKDDPVRLTKAKTRLREVLIGLALFICFWAIVKFLMPTASSDQGGSTTESMNVADPERPNIEVNNDRQENAQQSTSSPAYNTNNGNSSGQGSASPTVPSTSRPRSCGPLPAAITWGVYNIRKVNGHDEKVYTTRTGRTYAIYRQGDDRWGDIKRNGNPLRKTGCYVTSNATIMESFSNGPTFTPDSNSPEILESAKNNSNLNIQRSSICNNAGDKYAKIRCAIDNGGAVIVHIWANGNHYFPIVDYKYENGKYYYFLANTVDGVESKPGRKVGWFDESVFGPYICMPDGSVDCSTSEHSNAVNDGLRIFIPKINYDCSK